MHAMTLGNLHCPQFFTFGAGVATTLPAPSVSCDTPTTGKEIAPIPTSAIASQLAQKNEDNPDHTHSTQRLKLLSCSEY